MVIAVGDTHGQFKAFSKFLHEVKPSIVLQVGDFGYWPGYSGCNINDLKMPKDTKLYWCDGNHENHYALSLLKKTEIKKNIFYMRRGSTLTLPDGRTVLFMGGAASIDKAARRVGIDWFAEETISYADVERLPDVKVDIIVSHTCPKEFKTEFMESYNKEFRDASEDALSYLLEKYMPSRWLFGHFHTVQSGIYKDKVRWQLLNQFPQNGCYDEI